jgi:GTPase
MKTLYGNIGGLKASQLRRLENIYRRRIPPTFIITPELTRDLSELSHEIRRQIGLLINRQGRVAFVIVGDPQGIVIPDTEDYRSAPGRLRGLRCVHTHLKEEEPLSRDDLTDLAKLGLDLMAVITLTGEGLPYKIHIGHILPGASATSPCHILPPIAAHQLDMDCLEMIQALERELSQTGDVRHAVDGKERALLVSVSTGSRREAQESLKELEELSLSGGIEVVATQLQQRSQADSRYLMGRGKLQELSIFAMQKGISILVFDQELNPSQIRSITELIDLKVIDRTQLILDIFAQRAQTREGKRQVELAQLRYLLPRLVTKNTAMSRLTGGIGGRGPGETKLEINRRRVRERITRLEKDLGLVRKQRHQRRSRRDRRGTPVISIIGYTNAGKSTLLNTLTDSHVLAESRLFATLDPTSRRLRFPRDTEVIITDTVGFIRDLPKELRVAFRATLEELESADLLLHVVDVSNPRFEAHMASVDKVLEDLELLRLPCLQVFNKADLVDPELLQGLKCRLEGIFVSALKAETLIPLIEKMEQMVRHRDEFPLNGKLD